MTNLGIQNVNKATQSFYNKHSESFDRSRNFYWKGFNETLNFLKNGQNVLDFGCGNARFYKFLLENNLKLNYLGIDSNQLFIEENRKKYPNSRFETIDIISDKINIQEQFNLVVVFGLTHHIPSKEFRKNWFKNLEDLVMENGTLIISYWKFDITKDDKDFEISGYKRENNDYFLGWKGDYSEHRFCHYFNEEELEKIKSYFNSLKFKIQFEEEDNIYMVFSKEKK